MLALESVYRQTILPSEVIVVDDGSCPLLDSSIFCNSPSGLSCRLITHHVPQGAAKARNTGIENAIGHWIAFLDDDDAFKKEKLEIISNVISEHANVDIIYHPAIVHMINEGITYKTKPGTIPKDSRDALTHLLLRNEIGGTSMVIIKKEALIKAGMFSVELPAIEDFELWLKLARNGAKFHLLNIPLTDYYQNTLKQSLTRSLNKRYLAFNLIEKNFARELGKLTKKQKQEFNIRHLRANTYISLINYKLLIAFRYQLKVFYKTGKIRDLLYLFAVLLGPKLVFKFRSQCK